MLSLSFIAGAMTLPYAPASPEDEADIFGLSENPNSPAPKSPESYSNTGSESELLFKTTPPPIPRPLSVENPFSTSAASLSGTQFSDETNRQRAPLTQQSPVLKSDFLNAPIPQEFPSTNSATGIPELFSELSGITKESEIRRRGPLKYVLKLNTSAVYDDNVSLRSTNKRRALQLGIGPSARIFLGSEESALRVGATYTGTAYSYLDSPRERVLDQTLGVGAEWRGSRLRIAGNAGVQNSHNSSLDVGDKVGHRVFYAGGTASYEVTGKTSTELSADFTQAGFQTLLSSTEYRAQEFLNYQWSPKLQFGLGATQGVLGAENGTRQTYLQGLFRVLAKFTDKLGVSASAGNEWRRYDSLQPDTAAPVFGASAVWQATGKTTFAMDARRRTFASAVLDSQNYESTSTTFSAHEMLSATVGASLSIGVERARYSATSLEIQADREDQYLFSRIALDWLVGRSCSLGTFYELGNNHSTGSQGQSFRRNRIGVSLSLNF